MLFHPSNLPYWIFLCLGVILFLTVILAGGGDQDLQPELETNLCLDPDGDFAIPEAADAEVDGAVNLDSDLDADGVVNVLEVLGWLGIGRAPLVLLLATDLSLWGLSGWMLNVGLSNLLGRTPAQLLSGGVFLGSFAIALIAGRLIAQPLGQIFASFGEDASGERLMGCIGSVSSATIPAERDNRIGQINVIDSDRNLVTVNAIVPNWATLIPCLGDKVVIIDRQSQSYLVIMQDSPDQEQWMSSRVRTQTPD